MKKYFILLSSILIFCSTSSYSKESEVRMESGNLITNNRILFIQNSDSLTEETINSLKEIKDYLLDKKSISLLRIEGHVSYSDSKKSQELSLKRVLNISKWFIENGVDCNRLIAVGFGNTKPVEKSEVKTEESLNNRIVFSVAGLRGKLIGGLPADGGGLPIENLCEIIKE